MLLKRLAAHVVGEVEMTQTQVNSAQFLINQGIGKAPQSVAIDGDGEGGPIGIEAIVRFVKAED